MEEVKEPASAPPFGTSAARNVQEPPHEAMVPNLAVVHFPTVIEPSSPTVMSKPEKEWVHSLPRCLEGGRCFVPLPGPPPSAVIYQAG